MKIRCLIVDDEPLALDVLNAYITRIEGLELVGRCENALQAFALMQEQSVDLLFLDIQMPKLDGIEFIKTLQQKPKIIFTTAYRDYAIEAFELDAVDYLLKPIPFSRFLKALSKAYSQFQQAATTAAESPATPALASSIIIAPGISNLPHANDDALPSQSADSIIVRADKKMIKVPLEDIQYIESLKDYVIIHVGGRRIVTKQKISYLEQKLPDGKFLRIHRSFLVALHKIQAFSPNHVEINGQELPIGRSYKSEVAKVLGFV
jgi:DNA-binding LytR/AlgR family response regulator